MYRKAKVKLLKLLGFFLARRLLFRKVKIQRAIGPEGRNEMSTLKVENVCYDASHHGLRLSWPVSVFLDEEDEQVGEVRVEVDFDPRTGRWSVGHVLHGQATGHEELT